MSGISSCFKNSSEPTIQLGNKPSLVKKPISYIATQISNLATRGGAQNILKSVSDALSKVSQFATQAKREFIADLKKRPLAYLAATIATVGIVTATLFAPPMALALVGMSTLGYFVAAHVDKKFIKLNNTLKDQWGLVTKHPSFPIGQGLVSNLLLNPYTKGLKVHDVIENSVLANAGLQKGDRILKVNGKTVSDNVSLLNALKKPDADEKLTFEVKDGKKMQKTIQLLEEN